METSIPAGAAVLLDFIYRTETAKAPPACYDVIYGGKQGKLAKPLTRMTFDQVVAAQPSWTKRFGSSATGAAQFMRNTLDDPKKAYGDLKAEMGLTGKELFAGDLQDRMAFHLLKRRGYLLFVAGKISRTEFGKRLAQEWASFPVLAATQGAHRRVKRGETYYAGDRLNKSLVSPEAVEAMLDRIQKAPSAPDARSAPVEAPATLPGLITDTTTIEVVQRKLKELRYNVGDVDGIVGKLTREAILAFRLDNGLPLVPAIDAEMMASLDTAEPRELPRNGAEAGEIIDKVPEARASWWNKIVAIVIGAPAAIVGVGGGALDYLGLAKSTIEPIKDMVSDVPGPVWLGAVACVAMLIYLNAQRGENSIIEAFRQGARR